MTYNLLSVGFLTTHVAQAEQAGHQQGEGRRCRYVSHERDAGPFLH